MGRYLVRRVLRMLLVLWIISIVAFVLFFVAPHGGAASQACGRGCTAQRLALIEDRMGLNESAPLQYWHFLTRGESPAPGVQGRGLLHWPPNLGYSFRNEQPVLENILSRLPVTMSLVFGAAVIWLLIGVPIGILAATKPRSIRDRVATTFALTGVSMPTFFLGLIMLYALFYKLTVAGLPIFPPPKYVPILDNPLSWAHHLLLPWLTLALVFAAFYSRMVRGTLLDVLGEDYIRTARAKGLSERRVVYRHGLRAALTPVVTLLGLDVGGLLGGAVITEKLFTLPGVGNLAIDALSNQDLPVIAGVILFAAFFVVVANIIVDLVYAALDSRVRYS